MATGFGGSAPCAQDHVGEVRSPRYSSGIATTDDVVHGGMGEQVVLDLLGGDLLAAPVDLVLGPALDDEVAVGRAAARCRRCGRSRPR